MTPSKDPKILTMKEFARLSGVKYHTFYGRLQSGFSIMEAITLTEHDARSKSSAAKTHGMTHSKTYESWEAMHARCKKHPHYLKLGIAVCERWCSFEAFYADMGDRPEGMTLDRIKGKFGYSPGNCRWATAKTQCNNTSRNKYVTAFGKTQTVAEWAVEIGINERTLRYRIDAGIDFEIALTKKPKFGNRMAAK